MASSSEQLEPTPRTTLKRVPDRGAYDRATINAILDEGLICHLAFARDGQPHAIPTIYARDGNQLYVHGSSANRVLRALRDGLEACVTVTLIDGLVLGRSAFHTSMNFRSLVLYGKAQEVTDATEKLEALRVLVEHALPGRWKDVRGPNLAEFQRTMVLSLPIAEASAKVRTGGPVDDEEDYELGCWAGVIPVRTAFDAPVPDARLASGIPLPSYVRDYARPGARS
jgi:hypothetical protein